MLAVAHMVSTTGVGAVPWRGATTINSGNNPGFQLGSAEIAAKTSCGYDDDDQVRVKHVVLVPRGRGRLGGGKRARNYLSVFLAEMNSAMKKVTDV